MCEKSRTQISKLLFCVRLFRKSLSLPCLCDARQNLFDYCPMHRNGTVFSVCDQKTNYFSLVREKKVIFYIIIRIIRKNWSTGQLELRYLREGRKGFYGKENNKELFISESGDGSPSERLVEIAKR